MEVIFQDEFTRTGNVTLASHTPTTLGTSYTLVHQSAAGEDILVVAASDNARSDGTSNDGCIYSCDATYPSADYSITVTTVTIGTSSSTPLILLLRLQDQENMYAVRLSDTSVGDLNSRIYKKVTGTWTALGSLFQCPANGSVVKFQVIGSALKVYDDGLEVASATDTDITATGKAGIAMGGGTENPILSDDLNTTDPVFDDLVINNLGAAAGINTQVNIGGTMKQVTAMQIMVGGAYKAVTHAQIMISNAWKSIF